MDGDVSKEALINALEMAKEATERIYELQVKALKEKYAAEDKQ